MKTVPLGDILTADGLRNGISPSSTGDVEAEVLTLSAVTGDTFDPSARKTAKFAAAISSVQQVRDGMVMFCRGNGNADLVGRAVIADRDMPGVAYPDTVIGGFLDEDRFLRRTFLHLWRSDDVRHQVRSIARTTNGTFKINQQSLAKVRIPFPPLDEQRRIATILDQADAIRTKRRQILAHLGTLTQSIFRDMFGVPGDPRWDQVALGDVVDSIGNGTSPNCESRPAEPDEVGVLKLGAVTYGVFRPEENKAYVGPIGSMRSNEVRPGDVLMTRKNTRDLVGAVALVGDVRPGLLMPDLIFRLSLDERRIDRHYFHALMMNPLKRPAVRDLSSGSASSMPNISKARLKTLPLDLPPNGLQREFATRVVRVNAQRAAIEKCLVTDGELFAALQSRAFQGEL